MVKVSVIIPVYKVKKDYFRECLESVMNQSLKEIEIILVDDCGGDGAIEFAKEVTKQDSRVKFVYNEINRGAGQSRNEGIRAATGEFVGFVDADDIIDQDFYRYLYYCAKYHDSDIVKGVMKNMSDEKLSFLGKRMQKPEYVEQDSMLWFTHEHITGLYRREMLVDHKITYGTTRVSEDITFLMKANYHAKKAMPCLDAVYYYRDFVEGSATASAYDRNLVESMRAIEERLDFLKDHKDISAEVLGGITRRYMEVLERWKKKYIDFFYGVNVSMILPVRQGNANLDHLIESLLQQTMQNIEIICVDDGSVDGAAEKIRRYMETDNRIRYVLQEPGETPAGFLGLSHAKGAYVILLDADSQYEKNFSEIMFLVAEEQDADVVSPFRTYKQDVVNKLCRRQFLLENGIGRSLVLKETSRIAYVKEHVITVPEDRKQKVTYSATVDGEGNAVTKVSVVIPVYNMEKYLAECIDSILAQTMKEIQIICVNDGSKDRSLEILQEYAEKDERIFIVDKPNGGVAFARNTGLRLAEGKYVYFMDADDILDEDALEVLYSKAEENELDVLYFSADSFYETEELQKEHGGYDEYYHYKSLTDEVYDGGMLLYASAKEGSFRVGPPLQFLNREYLEGEGISFREDILFEDELFSTFVLLHAKRAMRIKDVLYQRRVREASAMTGKRNRKHFDSIFLIFTELLRESMSEKYTSVQKEALYQKMLRVSAACRRIYRELPAVERTEILQKLPNSHQFLFEHLEIWHKSNDLEARRKKDRENPLALRRSPARVRVRPLREAYQVISDVAVSVIIPMFNCEEYVGPLLDSLLQQTLQDMEIICADDGSSDQTADKVRQYMEKDARVSYYYQENTGAGAARNLGLKHAKGAYVIFLDADDLYQEDLLEKLYEAAERNQADVTTCWYTEKNFWDNSSVENLGFKTEVIPKRECFAPEEVNNLLMAFTQGPINKMFSRQFIEDENMLFSETRIANDVKFTQLALIVSSKIACVRENLITVRKHVNENSISSNRGKYTPHAIRAYRELYSELQKRGLAEEYETQICNSVGSAFHYNGRFSQDGTLLEALAEWLKEEPWTKYSRKEIEKYLRLRGLPDMERRRKELQKAFAEHSDKATEVQITFLENEIANVKLMCTHLDGIFNNTVSKQEHVIPNEIPNKTVKVRSENINRAPFLVRKTRGALQCWEDHGFIYTVKHFFRKVINKLTR